MVVNEIEILLCIGIGSGLIGSRFGFLAGIGVLFLFIAKCGRKDDGGSHEFHRSKA